MPLLYLITLYLCRFDANILYYIQYYYIIPLTILVFKKILKELIGPE